MKAKLDTKALCKTLTVLLKCVPSNATLPILENFLIEVKSGIMTITSFNLENRLSSVVPTLEITGKDTSFAVPAKLLANLVSTMPEGDMTLEYKPVQNLIECVWDNGGSTMPVFDSSDFPVPVYDPAKATLVVFPQLFMKTTLTKTHSAVSDENTNVAALTGVLFDIRKDGSNFVGSDRQTLVSVESPINGDMKFILPGRSAAIVKSFLEKSGDVTVGFDGKMASFSFGTYTLVSNVVNAKYPNYASVIPESNPNIMTVKKSVLESAVKRVMVCANIDSKMIVFKMSFDEARIVGEDLMYGVTANETVPCEYDGENLEVCFKAPALHKLLSNLECDDVMIKFMSSNKATLVMPTPQGFKDEPVKTVIMPMKAN